MDDLRHSLRLLRKTPGFSLAAIGVLALGIGLNAAMFGLVHALTLAARPFPEPDRLVQLYSRDARTTGGFRAFSHPAYDALRSRGDLFEGLLAHTPTIVGVGTGAEARRTLAIVASANYFSVLGVPLAAGRPFTSEEARPGQDIPVVVVAHSFWKRTGFDPAMLGQTIRVNGRDFTIIGITPEGFTGTMTVVGPELFFPLGVFHTLAGDLTDAEARTLERADAFNLFLVGRLRDGGSVTAASEALALHGRSLAQAFPVEHEHQVLSAGALPKFGTSTSPMDEGAIGTLGALLVGMTGAVLLTVCLNLASMLLARGEGRRRELAIRLALGGGRFRVVRQLLVEGALLSIAGGAIGFALGAYGIEWLVSSLTTVLPIAIALEGAVAPALAGSTIGFVALATLGFALGPAVKHARMDILSDLKAQPGQAPAPRRWRFLPRNPLVAAQVAVSMGLLIAAGLFLRMVIDAASVDIGFRASDTVLAEVDARLGGYDDTWSLDAYERIEQRLSALPGVRAASVGALVPFGFVQRGRDVQRAGPRPAPGSRPATPAEGQAFGAPWNAVGSAYFEAMGVRLLRGRPFTGAESYGRGAPRVVILDEHLARRLWPDGDALGQRVQWADDDLEAGDAEPLEVVGVVAATRTQLFEAEPRGAVYVPFAQGFASNVFFHVRPDAPGTPLEDAVRRAVGEAAPGVPLFGVRTFAAHVDASAEYWVLRLSTAAFALFGGLAFVVALVGIYGVTAYAVARRTREIGVRVAVGARPGAVVRMVVGEGLRTVAGGLVLGWLLGIGVGRVMAAIFVDLAAFDAWTFTVLPAGFVAVALAATWWPARRAAHVNPLVALRND